jgi:DNA-binding PadR family transcriptional regulator
MSNLKNQDILTILTYVSRKDISREDLLGVLSVERLTFNTIIEYLLREEMIVDRKGLLSIAEKGLTRARHFYEKKSHPRKKGKVKPRKRRGLIQIAVLQLLKEEARHGYEVMKLLEERSEGVYSPSAGTIYPALQDLLERGFILVDERTNKKIYSVTSEGLEFLSEVVQEEDEVFWEEWRLHLLWKQSKEALLLKEEMEKFQLEFQYAVQKVLHNPSLASDLAKIIKSGRDQLIEWSEKK